MSSPSNPSADPSKPPASKSKRLALGCGLSIVLAIALLFGLLKLFDKPQPEGAVPGPGADAMAERMMAAADVDAWARTGAVTWDFSGRQQHLWDRHRDYIRVRFKDQEVLLDLATRQGVATLGGQTLGAEDAAPLLEKAWAYWCNDSFWLNPVAKLFDDGTSRGLAATPDGDEGLLVTYGAGGVTPGDSYLWSVDADGLPQTWWMWTQILPVGGVKASWDDWITLDTGARVATRHKIGVLTLELTDVRGAATLGELTGGEDPFAPLESWLSRNP
ncbi:MAG: hypothetical protein AAGM22_13210 [Acidobacteriota bacterium]